MRIVWSLPVRGETLASSRGDVVRSRCLIAALRSLGHEVTVVEDAARPGSRALVGSYRGFVRRLLPRPVAWMARDVGRVLHARRHGRRVADVAREVQADLILETQVGFAGSAALAARLTGLPLVLDDTSPSAEERALGTCLPGLARRVLAANAAAAARIVASSKAVAAALAAEGLPAERIRIVPNGVNAGAADPGSPLPTSVSEALAALTPTGGAERCLAVFVGSFQPWHQVKLAVEALARVRQEAPGLRLLLVGDGPSRDPALQLARERGVEHLVAAPGAVEHAHLPAVLARCDLGLLPGSNDYGHPMKLVEYAAAGLPSVAPDLAPVREVVEDGVTGLLFPPGDVAALAGALSVLAADTSRRALMGQAARQSVVSATWTARAQDLVRDLR